jgi:ABC-type branched-subunit amino acid transport system ATPase component
MKFADAQWDVLLSVRDVSKSFGGVRAVVGVNFDLYKGELLGIIGPNGSGKTTLVNLITGFVEPDSGAIEYQGRNITGWMPYRIARLGIARTFQMVRPFAELPAYKNLIIPLFSPRVKGLMGGRYGDRDSVAKDLLEEVGFERESSVTTSCGSLPGYLKRLELTKCLALRARPYHTGRIVFRA